VALAERPEEIGYHVARTLRATGAIAPRGTAAFVEACLLRPWPGNVRELSMEVRAAAVEAATKGRELDADSLDPNAGMALRPPTRAGLGDNVAADGGADPEATPTPERAEVWAALTREHGNVARTAQALGLSRARLRRLIERWALDVDSLREP